MGFDNECILNIQSLAGEYFCPVCRTLVYPHEALQTQCTHLYCKPCLTYVVGSTQACPYDGYLVTEAGSKPLMESNKALAETIGKTAVHCLYHRSGCMWQGPLSECTAHCTGCAFGNSPVVCNRCGIQIVHRQVQEHAQTCNVNGTNTNTQTQGSETAQDAVSSVAAVSVDQSNIAAPASQPQTSHTATGPLAAQNLNQTAPANSLPLAIPATAVPTSEQWYQQQYYQQYPGYDPYQQGYQQYYPYPQQPAQQFQQPPPQPQMQQQIPAPIQPQPQVQPLPQPQSHPMTQAQGQGQPQLQMHSQPSNTQPQPLYPQAAVVGSSQNQGQVNPQQAHAQIHSQNQPLALANMPSQPYSQVQPPSVQNHAQPQMQVPQYQQMHHSQPPPVHPPFQPHPQPQSLPLPQSQPINPQHPPVQSVAGHSSYPSQSHQQIQHVPPQQHPMQVHPPAVSLPPAQFPQPPPHMRPPTQPPPHMLPSQGQAPGIPPTQQHIHPHSQPGLPPPHQRPVQQPMPQQYMQQPQAFPGQAPGQPHQAGSFPHPYPQVRPQGPPQPMQQSPLGFVQPPHGMPPQSYMGRPAVVNQGGIAPHARPPQFGPSQPSVNMSNQPHVYLEQQQNQYTPPLGGGSVDRKGDQTFERRVEQQEDKSPSPKKPESVANDYGANFNEVKPETGMNDEHKTGNGGEDGHSKDAASELHQVQGVPGDSVTTQRVKEERNDGALEHSPGGKLSHIKSEDGGVATIDSMKQGEASASFQGSSKGDKTFGQSQTTPQGQTGDVSGGFPSKGTEQYSHPEQGRSPLPPAPYAFSGQQQRPGGPHPGHPPSHLRPPGHGYLPHGPHPGQGESFPPPGPFHPEFPSAGPNRGYEPQSTGSHGQYNQGPLHGRHPRMSQGESLGPPLPHGPDGRHPGPMDIDMYQNQRPPHFDSRRPDSHDRGPYGQPFGAESSSMRMNGAPPPGLDSSSAPPFRDEKFRTPDAYPMGPARHHDQGEFKGSLKQFPGPPDSLKFGSHSSRPLSGYGMDGPSRFFDKDLHGYGFDGRGSGGFLPPYHSSGGMHDDNRGRFENNRQNPDFLGPMHGFGRHRMDRSPAREMERHSFGERYPMGMGPPGHMHRSKFDGPGKPRRNPSGFGSFHDYGDTNGPGGFSHQPPFCESFGSKSGHRPHLGEPGFRSSYSRQGFPGDGGYFSGGPDSFDPLRKRKNLSMGWCRICKIDCESVEGLDMHGQTREHQRMAMDMVISIKQKNAKKHKTSSDHSAREEPSKLRSAEIHARVNVS